MLEPQPMQPERDSRGTLPFSSDPLVKWDKGEDNAFLTESTQG